MWIPDAARTSKSHTCTLPSTAPVAMRERWSESAMHAMSAVCVSDTSRSNIPRSLSMSSCTTMLRSHEADTTHLRAGHAVRAATTRHWGRQRSPALVPGAVGEAADLGGVCRNGAAAQLLHVRAVHSRKLGHNPAVRSAQEFAVTSVQGQRRNVAVDDIAKHFLQLAGQHVPHLGTPRHEELAPAPGIVPAGSPARKP